MSKDKKKGKGITMYSMKKMTMKEFTKYKLKKDEFGLYDLKVVTIHLEKDKPLVCNHPVGSYFTLQGENFSLPEDQPFPLYCIASLLPLLPAKQRMNHPMDFMETDGHVKCPDPTCGGAFEMQRTGVTIFRNCEVSGALNGVNA